jgi:hypothetical protein
MTMVLLSGCGEDTSRWEATQEATQGNSTSVVEAALPGSTFNKFFPAQGGGVDVVFKQEKDGFAQANLLRSGTHIAVMSISDTRNNPGARDKFGTAAESVAGYPAVVQGNATTILVADRFQVRLQSEGEALTAADRADWLGKFDLAGLSSAF